MASANEFFSHHCRCFGVFLSHFRTNVVSQTARAKGFSFLGGNWWDLRLLALVNCFGHKSHAWVARFVRLGDRPSDESSLSKAFLSLEKVAAALPLLG